MSKRAAFRSPGHGELLGPSPYRLGLVPRCAQENPVRHSVHKLPFPLVVQNTHRTAPALQETKRFRSPPEFSVQNSSKSAPLPFQLGHSAMVQLAKDRSVFLLRF